MRTRTSCNGCVLTLLSTGLKGGASGRVWVCESEKGGGGGGGGGVCGWVVIADNDNQVRGQDNTPAQYSQHFTMRWCRITAIHGAQHRPMEGCDREHRGKREGVYGWCLRSGQGKTAKTHNHAAQSSSVCPSLQAHRAHSHPIRGETTQKPGQGVDARVHGRATETGGAMQVGILHPRMGSVVGATWWHRTLVSWRAWARGKRLSLVFRFWTVFPRGCCSESSDPPVSRAQTTSPLALGGRQTLQLTLEIRFVLQLWLDAQGTVLYSSGWCVRFSEREGVCLSAIPPPRALDPTPHVTMIRVVMRGPRSPLVALWARSSLGRVHWARNALCSWQNTGVVGEKRWLVVFEGVWPCPASPRTPSPCFPPALRCAVRDTQSPLYIFWTLRLAAATRDPSQWTLCNQWAFPLPTMSLRCKGA